MDDGRPKRLPSLCVMRCHRATFALWGYAVWTPPVSLRAAAATPVSLIKSPTGTRPGPDTIMLSGNRCGLKVCQHRRTAESPQYSLHSEGSSLH